MRIKFDKDLCMGYANCVVEAPELFDIDPDTDKAVILDEQPGEDMRRWAEQAVRTCPAVALRLES